MIDKENFPAEKDPIPGQEDQDINLGENPTLEAQEQVNNDNLIQQIEQDNKDLDDNAGDITSDVNMGAPAIQDEAPAGRAGETAALKAAEMDANAGDSPNTKNLLGDNPPGSEDKAFNSEHPGDLSADQVKYNAENIRENFRENIDKTASEINLDKRLKED